MRHVYRDILSDPPSEAEFQLMEIFLGIIRHGMVFKPRLVTSGGKVVGYVPELLEAYFMKCQILHKENGDEKSAARFAVEYGNIIKAKIRASRARASNAVGMCPATNLGRNEPGPAA
jgi:hypothetical protein